MEKWKYRSLEWIHRVREEEYEKSKNLSPRELVERTRKSTESAARNLKPKIEKTHKSLISK
ncbi:MAG: hypothetical protein JW765_05185 [Deltaproteobacteria bacterium]|nr:hypothetical protein [Candidatus Zymogenaceae bacterium]